MIPPAPGSIGFAHTKGVLGKLIRVGEWLSLRKCDFNHQFIVDDTVDVDGVPFIIQATLRGVTDTARLDQVAPGGRRLVLPLPDGVRADDVLAFAKAQVGVCYGLGTILAIAIDIVTWGWFPSFRSARKQSWICSALANESLRFGGWLHEWDSIYTVMPQESYNALLTEQSPDS